MTTLLPGRLQRTYRKTSGAPPTSLLKFSDSSDGWTHTGDPSAQHSHRTMRAVIRYPTGGHKLEHMTLRWVCRAGGTPPSPGRLAFPNARSPPRVHLGTRSTHGHLLRALRLPAPGLAFLAPSLFPLLGHLACVSMAVSTMGRVLATADACGTRQASTGPVAARCTAFSVWCRPFAHAVAANRSCSCLSNYRTLPFHCPPAIFPCGRRARTVVRATPAWRASCLHPPDGSAGPFSRRAGDLLHTPTAFHGRRCVHSAHRPPFLPYFNRLGWHLLPPHLSRKHYLCSSFRFVHRASPAY